MANARGRVHIGATFIVPNEPKTGAWANEDRYGYSGAWRLASYAICAY